MLAPTSSSPFSSSVALWLLQRRCFPLNPLNPPAPSMMEPPCSSSSLHPRHPCSTSLLVRLHRFLNKYEDGADPAGVDCQNILHSVIGAAALKRQLHTITDLLEEASHTDSKIESSDESFLRPTSAEIERIEAEVRGRKLQEQERAVEMANQLYKTFSVWQQEVRGAGSETGSSCKYNKYGNVIACNTLVESNLSEGSADAMDCMTLCQFLVDLELGKLEDKIMHDAWQSKRVASSTPDLSLNSESTSDIQQEDGHRTSLSSRERSFTVEHAVDDGAYHKLQRKLSYLLEFRGKLDEENWRAGVDVGLIFSYFKILLEFLMNQVTAWVTDLADVKDQLHSNQEDLRMTKLSLEESRCQVEKLRTENTILSTFVDQLTEEVESCQSDILDCRDALKNASMQSAVSKTEFQELYEQTFTLRRELESRLEKEVAEVKKLSKELETVTWDNAAESLVYFEVVDAMSEEWSNTITTMQVEVRGELEKQGANVKRIMEKLVGTEWEHSVQSSIYLEVLNGMAVSSSQHINYLENRLSKEQDTNVKAMVQNLREKEWEHAAECIVYLEVLYETAVAYSQESNDMKEKLCKVQVQKGMLKTEIEELHRRLEEIEDSTWRSKTELSIYFTVFDDTARKLSEELLHLRADLSNEGASLMKLKAVYAELEKSMKELGKTLVEQKVDSSICLDVVDAVVQEWSLEVNKAMSELKSYEGALEGTLEQKDLEIKRLTEELELTIWEHEMESSIYLEVVGERACEWRQLIDSLSADFNRKQIVRRKELQASCSFSGRTQKENQAFEDSSPLAQGDLEGLKSALRKPSPLKGLSTLSDQSVSSPGKATDPIYVVVRRNTQAAVEGFMVDIGESPSKRTNKEVVSSLKMEVLDLRREKEQLIEHHSDELNKLEFEFNMERERMKVELEREFQIEVARLHDKLESQHKKDAEQIQEELKQTFQIKFADLHDKLESEHRSQTEAMEVDLVQRYENEIAELRGKMELEHRNRIEGIKFDVEHKHRKEIADLQETLELKYKRELERIKFELEQKRESDLAKLHKRLDHEAMMKADEERRNNELERIFQKEIAALEAKLVAVKQKLEQGSQENKELKPNAEDGSTVSPEDLMLSTPKEICDTKGCINDTLLTQLESDVVTLVTERDELCDRVLNMEIQISELQDKVTKLEGERSWLEERVPGLEKKLATEQSRLEDTVAGHAFERDQLKLIVSSHKNEQTKLENELAERKAERNHLATAIALLAIACRNLKVSNQNERERWRSAYMMALKDMERALSRTQKQVKEERAQKGSAESDAQRMKAEIYTMQQESKDVWRLLERTIAEHISRAVGTSQQVEFGLCRKIHQQTLRFEAVQQQVDNLLQLLRQSQMSEMDYLRTVENLQRAEQEVDVLGDEVDSLVALLEKVHIVMNQYAPVLLHYPGVAEVVKLVQYELFQRDMIPSVPA
ncbi:uncharacterized protein [Physcomitrium patens]|uniref:Uncharacterized protein n=1 Tax=Physcomitrium patens TaxID=3218 RepID=A0A7I4B188_PHYPA